jgi:hypothetical protein
MSLVRGLAVVARSPAILISTFLALFAIWAGLNAYLPIIPVSPAAMVLILSLPPVHSFLDLQYLNAGAATSSVVAIGFGSVTILVRAGLASWWISVMRETLRPQATGEQADAPSPVRSAAGRAARLFVPMIGLEAVFMLLAILAQFVASGFLGAGLGQLAVMAVLIGGMFFLVYAPVTMVLEGIGVRPAIRLSARAARVPGPRHMLLTFGYLALTLVLSSFAPASRMSQATPTIMVWAYGLLVSFLHVAILATFAHRWLLIRRHMDVEQIIEGKDRALRSPRPARR